MVRIVCISDTHLRHELEIPRGDILIHAGDFTFSGNIPEINKAMVWFGSLPHKHKVFIAGNHDWLFERGPGIAQSLIPPSTNIHYLQDSEVTLMGVRIYGAPWQPEFCNWAFNLPRGGAKIKAVWDMIPEGIDVLVTHGPPQGILDLTNGQYHPPEHVGCSYLLERVRAIKPQLHMFGHIHGGYGLETIRGTTFVNASICDEAYQPNNKPIVVTVKAHRETRAKA